MLIRIDHLHTQEVARLGVEEFVDENKAVDLRRVRRRARDGAFVINRVDQHFDLAPDPGGKQLGGDVFLHVHQAAPALFAHLIGHGARQFVGGGAFDRRVGKAADAVEPRFFDELEQFLELGLGLAREAGDEGAADGNVGADLAPGADALQVVLGARRPLHRLEDARIRVLERHVEVRQDLALGHQRDEVIDARVRIDVVQAHPDAEFGQRLAQFLQARLDRTPAEEAGAVFHIDAVGAGVLRDDQQLAHAGFGEVLRFGEHVADRPADERTAQ